MNIDPVESLNAIKEYYGYTHEEALAYIRNYKIETPKKDLQKIQETETIEDGLKVACEIAGVDDYDIKEEMNELCREVPWMQILIRNQMDNNV